jgi:type IV pilus assembly protein PilE
MTGLVEKRSGIAAESGFSLVELMVVVAIMAILASVATPAYINYQNRSIQSEAIEAVLRAKMDQESYWAENNTYADTIGCLASFGNDCDVTSYTTPNGYVVSVDEDSTDDDEFIIDARKKVFSYAPEDVVQMSNTNQEPVIPCEAALKTSLFKMLFE